jgi:hypothetical protein
MTADFARQIVDPPRVRCIGVELQPFSLGHLFILKELGNPVIYHNGFPTYEHLIAAAIVCAHTWEENQKLLRSRFRRWLIAKVWGLFAGKFDIAKETVRLKAYVINGMDFPEIKPPKRNSCRHLFSDDDTRLYSFLRLRMTHSEAMNFPLRAANLMWSAHLEESGLLELKSQRDYDIEEKMIRILEQEEAKS